ncbi:MAG: tRNA (adenosine(37)-N6)-threonylcarbamoyltransferase complex transferase subunit TsaD [Endomicrobia bacterium]|nr:tRNA (adenosine(37)-N6)-threonylcarbamoyltransferase complex transferase subunit TsaD [Endomicrobiia bacterium]
MTKQPINVLGIETSCDETAAAVVDSNYNIISNIIFSQQKLHAPYFGVVPELASRTHYEKIQYVVKKALTKISIKKINLISYTEQPGLKGALLIGKTVAKTLGYLYSIPTIGVNHLWGHIHSVILSYRGKIKFPFVSLIISGGHTELSIVESYTERKVLGQTRDDAVGESFDKIAKLLSFSIKKESKQRKNAKLLSLLKKFTYPGGPVVEKLAKYGDPKAINFPRPYMLDSWDFSFSGIKTAVLYYLNSQKRIQPELVYNICASFQESIVDTLVTKITYAAEKFNCRRIVISGGVSANQYLRKRFMQIAKQKLLEVYFPKKNLFTDNAAMISCAGYHFFTDKC